MRPLSPSSRRPRRHLSPERNRTSDRYIRRERGVRGEASRQASERSIWSSLVSPYRLGDPSPSGPRWKRKRLSVGVRLVQATVHAKPEIQCAIAALGSDRRSRDHARFCARPSRNNLFVGGAKMVPTIYGPRYYADAGG